VVAWIYYLLTGVLMSFNDDVEAARKAALKARDEEMVVVIPTQPATQARRAWIAWLENHPGCRFADHEIRSEHYRIKDASGLCGGTAYLVKRSALQREGITIESL
jgi:hypothetical protein